MKSTKSSKRILSLIMAIVMMASLAFATTALAEEPDVPVIPIDDPEPISGSYNFWTSATGSWATILSDSSGLNCNVRITRLGGSYRLGVRMYSGNTYVWGDNNAVSSTRTFWCGSNITSIQVCLLDSFGNPVGSWITESIHVEAPV